jgi:hypothetical protein
MKTSITALVAVIATIATAISTPVGEIHMAAVVPRDQGKRPPHIHGDVGHDFRLPCDCPPPNCPEGLIKDKKSVGILLLRGPNRKSRGSPYTHSANANASP